MSFTISEVVETAIPVRTGGRPALDNPFAPIVAALVKDGVPSTVAKSVKVAKADAQKAKRYLHRAAPTGATIRVDIKEDGDVATITFWAVPQIERKSAQVETPASE